MADRLHETSASINVVVALIAFLSVGIESPIYSAGA